MKFLSRALALGCVLALAGCGLPAHDLSDIEKTADIEWVYGVFEHNYAPADWKKSEFGVSLAQAKQDCLSEAKPITKADAFTAHLSKCVNRFADAHTRTMSGGATLPEFAKIAYLGFVTETKRMDIANAKRSETDKTPESKNPPKIVLVLHIKDLLPTTIATDSPVHTGDDIVEIDGKGVAEYLTSEMVPYSNLGHSDSSLVVTGASFALRTSFTYPLPSKENITLKVMRARKLLTVNMPWTVKDLLAFREEQSLAKKSSSVADANKTSPAQVSVGVVWDGEEVLSEMMDMAQLFRKQAGDRISLLLHYTFARKNFDPTLNFVQSLFATQATSKNIPVEDAMNTSSSLNADNDVFQARVFIQEDGSRIGYIRLATFSVADYAADKLAELHARFTKMKVKGVIYDALNNGGGSLVAGLRMANMLMAPALQFPKIQVALNTNWMNSFHATALYSGGTVGFSDARRTMAKRVYEQLVAEQKSGMRISSALSVTELDPFVLGTDKATCQDDGKCLASNIKRVLLVNEMCASMCDIFASVFRDNHMGLIVGSQTMGAGGNVTMHGMSPVSQIMMRQTESLIVDTNGKYLENQGVVPDDAIDTLMDAPNYPNTYKKAFELINKQ